MLPIAQQELVASQDGPLVGLALLACAIWVSKLWLDDFRSHSERKVAALPGALPCSAVALWIASLGAIAILLAETFGEKATGLDTEQATIAWHFLAAMVAAAVLEELVFRGYLVVTGRGRAALIASVLGFSLLFALAHPFIWTFKQDQGLILHFDDRKAWFTTSFLFLKSLWFYYARFAPWNPRHSLLPCVAAHLAVNLATFAIKAIQGYVNW